MQITLNGEVLLLLPERAVYWAARKTLWVADPHMGKATHFNKAGLAVPRNVGDADLQKLSLLIDSLGVERLIFLGDLFHSKYNTEWDKFGEWLQQQNVAETHLVMGNHDILKPEFYHKYNLIVHNEQLIDGPFVYVHEYVAGMEATFEGQYIISGHMHPGIYIAGKARQGERLPCFYFGENHAVLPAFGQFTGLYLIERLSVNDAFYVIANTHIIKV